MSFKPIKKNKRIFELVTDEIKKTIFSGSLKPGDRLTSERDLSLQMKVGRSAIRESLRTLELSGLIYVKQGVDGGIFVKEPDTSNLSRSFSDLLQLEYITIEDLTEARLLIERDILEFVMKKVKREDFKPLDDIIITAFKKIERGEKIRKENLEFHKILAKLSDNPIFIMLVDSIMSIISVFVEKLNPSLEHSLRILESHKDILEEMRKGDMGAAKEKLDEHILFFSKEFKSLKPLKGYKIYKI